MEEFRILGEIEELSKNYEECSESINTPDGLESCAKLSLSIFMKVAELARLPLKTVSLELEKVFESREVLAFEGILEESFPPYIPEFGRFRASYAEGTVLFVDITSSTKYFQEEIEKNVIQYVNNYTGFVIFNSYILLVKSITKVFGGEFLEHTGDGAMLFFEGKDFVCEYKKAAEFFKEPIGLCFLAAEKLKRYAKQKGLIRYDKVKFNGKFLELFYQEPSLVHIGASFGEVLQVQFGNMKKLVSKTVWEAADRCKKASREVRYKIKISNGKRIYLRPLPIKCD